MYKQYREKINLQHQETNTKSPKSKMEENSENVQDENVEEKSTSFTYIDEKTNKQPQDLQEAFLKYRKKRQKEIKRVRKVKNRPNELQLKARADPERMQWLRMKFLEQSKKYFGVPYARKYWNKDNDEFYSPIFLDCCGLVRRCMRDLKRDFGFRLGPWNQAYMYDTLPVTVEKEEDMKPGDLVFISATYYSKKSKKQPHNMTHVEIWLGDGPKTIGARWNNGKVQVFDSYKFTAKSYHSEKYIFKSIDTWLMGICRSHCPDHPWRTRAEKFTPCKKSIFSVQQNQQQEKDQSAGGSDVEQLENENPNKTANNLVKSPLNLSISGKQYKQQPQKSPANDEKSESIDLKLYSTEFQTELFQKTQDNSSIDQEVSSEDNEKSSKSFVKIQEEIKSNEFSMKTEPACSKQRLSPENTVDGPKVAAEENTEAGESLDVFFQEEDIKTMNSLEISVENITLQNNNNEVLHKLENGYSESAEPQRDLQGNPVL